MRMQRTSLIVIGCLMTVVPAVSHAEDARELVERYKETLNKQARFAFQFSIETHRSAHTVRRDPLHARMSERDGETDFYSAGELLYDGRRVALRQREWGQRSSLIPILEANPAYRRNTFNGRVWVTYFRSPQNPDAKGKVGVWNNMSREDMEKVATDDVSVTCEAYPLLGYISLAGDRMDTMLENAQLGLRDEKEAVNGVDCWVIDYQSRHGRGTIWLDSEHGHNIAKAQVNISTGDIVYGKPVRSDGTTDMHLHDVTFEKVDGVWFPSAGIFEFDAYRAGDREKATRRITLSEIRLNPDLVALNAFHTNDIPDGARAGYLYDYSNIKYVWRGGRPVPEDLQQQFRAPAAGRPAPLWGSEQVPLQQPFKSRREGG